MSGYVGARKTSRSQRELRGDESAAGACPLCGHEHRQIAGRNEAAREARQNVGEVLVRIDPEELARAKHRVRDRRAMAADVGARKQICPAPLCRFSMESLNDTVVYGQLAVIEEPHERVVVIRQIPESLTEL